MNSANSLHGTQAVVLCRWVSHLRFGRTLWLDVHGSSSPRRAANPLNKDALQWLGKPTCIWTPCNVHLCIIKMNKWLHGRDQRRWSLRPERNVPAENCYYQQQILSLTPAIRPEIQTNECTTARLTVHCKKTYDKHGTIIAPPSACGERTRVDDVMHISTLSITTLLTAFRINDSFPQFKRDAFDNRSAIPPPYLTFWRRNYFFNFSTPCI